MNERLGTDSPLFLQIKQKIEDMIVSGSLQAGDQVPSSTNLVNFYQVNHLTVLKGMNLLVDEGVIYKKRGVGMFVADDARIRLLQQRREQLSDQFIRPLLREARYLEVSLPELVTMITNCAKEE
ncbi:GntR family transcriptional regulator [Spirochaeta africana]|uniref:Putative transcriptional regulator n=1 Tax=Spirochaeta africana (strain ATCC 700263 / DSM 8902 / Z-7692) TaxID=889378 RepID=H9UHT1_SPIAZ|nr:GntR family transcriptional regulator [Spirochaeta africana]AFG37074.1 putative transcriptional regulator [Spirochaeta africana DSM 8902]